MNGYNWEAFFDHYLENHAPELLDELYADPESGLYSAYYTGITPENKAKAQKFADIICSLIEEETELYRIIREEGEEIEWD